MENRNKVLAIVISLGLLGLGSAGAIWVSNGMEISGTLTATTGEIPDPVVCTNNIDIVDNSNTTTTCSFDNPNGNVTMSFACNTTAVFSTDERCNFEGQKDVKVFLSSDNQTFMPCESTPSYVMEPGLTTMIIRMQPSPNRCPLSGSYSIIGTLTG